MREQGWTQTDSKLYGLYELILIPMFVDFCTANNDKTKKISFHFENKCSGTLNFAE